MGLMDLLSGKAVQNAALGALKKYMIQGGIKLAAIVVRDTPSEDGEDFDFKFYKESVVIIPLEDLEYYKNAVQKCIENEIDL